MATCEMETQAGASESPKIISGPIEGIPLYLIPVTIAEQIKVKREQVFMITVERGLHHCYTINVETFDEYTARMDRADKRGDN